jgi:hypothetical protein
MSDKPNLSDGAKALRDLNNIINEIRRLDPVGAVVLERWRDEHIGQLTETKQISQAAIVSMGAENAAKFVEDQMTYLKVDFATEITNAVEVTQELRPDFAALELRVRAFFLK